MSLTTEIADFVQQVTGAMGASLTVSVEEAPEATRINLVGDDGGVLIRRGGEGLQALQHLVATAFRRKLGDESIAAYWYAKAIRPVATGSHVAERDLILRVLLGKA